MVSNLDGSTHVMFKTSSRDTMRRSINLPVQIEQGKLRLCTNISENSIASAIWITSPWLRRLLFHWEIDNCEERVTERQLRTHERFVILGILIYLGAIIWQRIVFAGYDSPAVDYIVLIVRNNLDTLESALKIFSYNDTSWSSVEVILKYNRCRGTIRERAILWDQRAEARLDIPFSA